MNDIQVEGCHGRALEDGANATDDDEIVGPAEEAGRKARSGRLALLFAPAGASQ